MSIPRRRWIVEGFQARFVITELAWLTLSFAAFAVLLVGPIIWLLNHDPSSEGHLQWATLLLELNRRLWLPLAGLFLAVLVMLVRLSHRVAGPLYRFRQIYAQVARGELAVRVRIRKGDYLWRECGALEAMLTAIRERVQATQRAADDLESELAALRTSPYPLTTGRLSALAAKMGVLRRAVDQFRVASRPAAAPAPRQAPQPAGRDAGFSLVEIVIVTFITTALAGIAMPVYTTALESARVARAIGDINAIGKDLMFAQIAQNCLPASLGDVGQGAREDPWGRPYVYSVLQGPGGGNPKGKAAGKSGGNGAGGGCQACQDVCVPVGSARKDKFLVPLNADFDLYSLGKDGKSSSPITAKTSRDDVIRARNGGFIGLAASY